jgi:putative DNA primase/helicase
MSDYNACPNDTANQASAETAWSGKEITRTTAEDFSDQRFFESLSLAHLHVAVRWCAWATELGEGSTDGKPAKIPRGRAQRYAKSNDQTTWLAWHEARQITAIRPRPFGMGGIGIFLGSLGTKYENAVLCGVDLDVCFNDNGTLTGWAADILAILEGTYCEASPSGTGVKAFFLVPPTLISMLRKETGISRWSRSWKLQAAPDTKAPGVEIHTDRRWFAVTGETFTPLGMLDADRIQALAYVLKTWFGDTSRDRPRNYGGDTDVSEETIANFPMGDHMEETELNEGEQALLEQLPGLSALWRGEYTLGEDRSTSAVLWRMAGMLARANVAVETASAVMRKCPQLAGWLAEKPEWDERRQLARAWYRQERTEHPLAGVAEAIFQGETMAGVAADDHTADPGGALSLISEVAMANWMVDDNHHQIRYLPETGQWRVYNTRKWEIDHKAKKVARMAIKLADKIVRRPTTPGAAIPKLRSKHTIQAIEGLAQSDPRIAAKVDDFDQDPWMLNTPSGTIDLRTGKLQPHNPLDMLTKLTAAGPDDHAGYPHWAKFLSQITDGDHELAKYLQRVAGYCLTGVTDEHAMFFFYGDGTNGKGTFLRTLLGLLDKTNYARSVAADMFTQRKYEAHPDEIAQLHGARLAVTGEIKGQHRWEEGRLKEMTGGDFITARFMYGSNFTFKPQFKLIAQGNSKPRITRVDTAIRRRMNLVPFSVDFTTMLDPHLDDKLKTEFGPILSWAVRGCLEWQRIGLCPPKKVVGATAKYLQGEDTYTLWFEECCTRVSPEIFARLEDLYGSWSMWAVRAGEQPGSRRIFSEWLGSKRFEKGENRNHQCTYGGVMLNNSGTEQPTDSNGRLLPFVKKKDIDS